MGACGGRPNVVDAEKLAAVIVVLDVGATKAAVCSDVCHQAQDVDRLWPGSAGLLASRSRRHELEPLQRLNEAQLTELFDPPTKQREFGSAILNFVGNRFDGDQSLPW